MTLDFVDALTSDDIDYVHRIYGSGHDRFCDYRPSVNDRGLIYCETCGSQISSIHVESSNSLTINEFTDLCYRRERSGANLFGNGIKDQRNFVGFIFGKRRA